MGIYENEFKKRSKKKNRYKKKSAYTPKSKNFFIGKNDKRDPVPSYWRLT